MVIPRISAHPVFPKHSSSQGLNSRVASLEESWSSFKKGFQTAASVQIWIWASHPLFDPLWKFAHATVSQKTQVGVTGTFLFTGGCLIQTSVGLARIGFPEGALMGAALGVSLLTLGLAVALLSDPRSLYFLRSPYP